MIKSTIFTAPVSDDIARQRLIAFLTQHGYRQLPDRGGHLRFKRGSVVGTLVNFDPTRWASLAIVVVKSAGSISQLDAEVSITADPFERSFAQELLDTELDLLKVAVTTNEFDTLDVGELKGRIRSYVFRVVVLFGAFFVSALFGAAAGVFSLTTLGLSAPTAGCVGAAAFVIPSAIVLVMWRRHKKLSGHVI